MNNNPLMMYAPHEKVFCKLPSSANFYLSGVLQNNKSEVGIKPMTAKDEMLMNNPEALMNGKAIELVIQNCCPSVLDASKLAIMDVEAILLGIKKATGDETYDFTCSCPQCKKEGEFKRDIDGILSSCTHLEKEYVVDFDPVKVYLQPSTWEDYNNIQQLTFRQQKMLQVAKNQEISDDEKSQIFNDVFRELVNIRTELMVNCIQKIEVPGNIVTDKTYIREYVNCLDKNSVSKLSDVVENINSKGCSHSMDAECSYCEHKWTITDLKFDPSSFFV